MTKLYVGNLPSDFSQDEIRALFTQAGEVGEVKLVNDRKTLLPKGVAFVSMTNAGGNEEAIKRFNDYSVGENKLKVREARLRADHLRSGPPNKSLGNHPKNG